MTMTTPRPAAPQQPWPSRREREGGRRTRRETASVDRPVARLPAAAVTHHPQVASGPVETGPRRRPRHAASEPTAPAGPEPSAPESSAPDFTATELTRRLPVIPRQRFASDAPSVATSAGVVTARPAPIEAPSAALPTSQVPTRPAPVEPRRPSVPPDPIHPPHPVTASQRDLGAVPDHRGDAGRVPAAPQPVMASRPDVVAVPEHRETASRVPATPSAPHPVTASRPDVVAVPEHHETASRVPATPSAPHPVTASRPDVTEDPNARDAAGRVPAPRPPRPAVGSGVRRGPSEGPTAHRVDGRTRVPRNGLGVAALCLGLVGLPLGLVPVTGFLAAGLGVLAVAFGIAGWSRTRSRKATNTGSAVTGAVVGLVALVLGVVGTIVFFQNPDRLVYDVTALTDGTPTAVVSPIGE